MRLLRVLSVALVLAVCASALSAPAALADPVLPVVEGPDVPPLSEAEAVVVPYDDEAWSFSGATRGRTFTVPTPSSGASRWDRVILEFSSRPDGDPWDRLFVLTIDDAEVLRGTTPRTEFTVTKDITEYASLLVPGTQSRMRYQFSSWVGALRGTVRLSFYDDEPTAPRPAFDHVVAGPSIATLHGAGRTQSRTVAFPDGAPQSAVVEVGISGHGQEGEFWYLNTPDDPPTFGVLVDGVEVAEVLPTPWVYALIGTTGNNGDNGPAFWSVHRVLDAVGVSHGWGIIPAQRASLPADELGLLSGERTVEVVQKSGGPNFPTTVNFLLDGIPADNCLRVANPEQADTDGDGVGDACDGPRVMAADGVRDGGIISEGDPLILRVDRPVTCAPEAAAGITYGATTALAITCDGSEVVEVRLPDRAMAPDNHGVVALAAGVLVGADERSTAHVHPVAVTAAAGPLLVSARGVADGSDRLELRWDRPVDCGSAVQTAMRFSTGEVVGRHLQCDDTTALLSLPDGTVGMALDGQVLTYTPAESGAVVRADADATPAALDQVRIVVTEPAG